MMQRPFSRRVQMGGRVSGQEDQLRLAPVGWVRSAREPGHEGHFPVAPATAGCPSAAGGWAGRGCAGWLVRAAMAASGCVILVGGKVPAQAVNWLLAFTMCAG
jgi:hypothetical protein